MFSFVDQGFEDTENSNFIAPQFQLRGHSPVIAPHLAIETQHASLKRKKHEKGEIQDGSPPLDRSPGGQLDLSQHRPLSMVVGSQSESGMSISTSTSSLSRQVYLIFYFSYSQLHRPSILFRISLGIQVTCTYIT